MNKINVGQMFEDKEEIYEVLGIPSKSIRRAMKKIENKDDTIIWTGANGLADNGCINTLNEDETILIQTHIDPEPSSEEKFEYKYWIVFMPKENTQHKPYFFKGVFEFIEIEDNKRIHKRVQTSLDVPV